MAVSRGEIVVAIPSYQRGGVITGRTLRVLAQRGVPAGQIEIWVAGSLQRTVYTETVPEDLYGQIRVGPVGLSKVRTAIMRAHPAGTPILFCDDDLDDVCALRAGDKPRLVPARDILQIACRGFDTAAAAGARLWGVAPAANAFFMKPGETAGLMFAIGSFYGLINDQGEVAATELDEKEDYERTLRCWEADGSVVRLRDVTVKSTYYRGGGGMVATRTVEAQEAAVRRLEEKWPGVVRRNGRRASDYPEIRLAAPKVVAGKTAR